MAYKAKAGKKANPEAGSFAVSPARREAFGILLELERGRGHADELLRGERVTGLRESDRNLTTTLVMGALRWQRVLDAAIRAHLSKPNAKLDAEVRVALRVGAYQVLYLDRIPAHAAIGESVALAKAAGHTFAAGMVNAVLRKVAAGPRPEKQNAAQAYPEWLVARWRAEFGADAAGAICRHGQEQPRLALRMGSSEAEAELAVDGILLEPGALLTAARVVVGGDVTASPLLRDGWVRIQEEGSQLIAELAGEGARILDMCAAPGGKTLVLAERNRAATVVACESNPARMLAIGQRFEGMRQPELTGRIELVLGDGKTLEAEPFDVVLADVPCSGTGTLGRNPEIRHRLRVEELGKHQERQSGLLRSALRLSRGRVVYSTCSLEPEENGAVVAAVLAENPGWRQVSVAGRFGELKAEGRLTEAGAAFLLAAVDVSGALKLVPGRMETDGFFAAVLERV
jgi:16S rRNA (cytosine967-C5)-methyltransferase